MTGWDGALVLSATFTVGCAAIHLLREHARALTPVLLAVALVLGAFTGLVSLAERGVPADGSGAPRPARPLARPEASPAVPWPGPDGRQALARPPHP